MLNFEHAKLSGADYALSKCQRTENTDGTVNIVGYLRVKFPLKYLPKIKNLNGAPNKPLTS